MQGQAEQAPHADSLCAPKAQITSQIWVWLTPSGSGTRRYFRPRSTKGSPFRLFRIAARSILLILSRLFFIGLSVLKVCAHICVTFGGHNQFASINERARLNIYQWFISHFAAAFPLGKLLRRKNLLGYVRAFCQRVAVLTVFCLRSFAL